MTLKEWTNITRSFLRELQGRYADFYWRATTDSERGTWARLWQGIEDQFVTDSPTTASPPASA